MSKEVLGAYNYTATFPAYIAKEWRARAVCEYPIAWLQNCNEKTCYVLYTEHARPCHLCEKHTLQEMQRYSMQKKLQ